MPGQQLLKQARRLQVGAFEPQQASFQALQLVCTLVSAVRLASWREAAPWRPGRREQLLIQLLPLRVDLERPPAACSSAASAGAAR